MPAEHPLSSDRASPRAGTSGRWSLAFGNHDDAILRLIPVVEQIRGFGALRLVEIAVRALDYRDVTDDCRAWLQQVFPPSPLRSPRRRPNGNISSVSRKRLRRREYARVQRLFRASMGRAAREVLDGAESAEVPDVEAMSEHWGPYVSTPSLEAPQAPRGNPRPDLEYAWHPVTCEEVQGVAIPISSAPGIDGITARQWRAVPSSIKALFFNIVLFRGSFPEELLVSRTVFVPKKVGANLPADFRPISIASVVVRHLHKILAQRLREGNLVDDRQRCFDDGCAENITALAALLEDSRRSFRELHVVSLDVAKAFDSVSHNAIRAVLGRAGLPPGFTTYIARTYTSSWTVFEVGGARSERVRVNRGVRQGDPLSSLLFCLVVNEVLRAVPAEVGYDLGGCRHNALAYADDVLLLTATRSGMQSALRRFEDKAATFGLSLHAAKCVALSIVPAGKQKKSKVLVEPQFHLVDGTVIKQLSPTQEWRYLGVDFRPVGPIRSSRVLTDELDRLTRAPLKPQQRVKILRCFLIPRFYHALVLAGATLGKLRALDKQVRVSLRRWLRFPNDTAVGYFHAPVKDGGLGVPSFATTVPGLLYRRLGDLESSSSPSVRAVATSGWVHKRLGWAARALSRDGMFMNTPARRESWWAKSLHSSVDGRELRECGRTNLSTFWVDAGSSGIPGRDYVQYHHVRVNCLPSRVRTTRGVRRLTQEVQCRAGCRVTETAAHIIQACHRTHGGRIKRHNAVCKVLASGLRDKGWTVTEEPRIRTPSGLRKPDLVAVSNGRVEVIDAQVVSGATSLDDAHTRKSAYYADNADVGRTLAADHRVGVEAVAFSSCTLSWRGVWSSRSADYLLGLGLSKRLLAGITTRVLQGSHTNWNRWNRMVGVVGRNGRGAGAERVGVG